MRQILVRVAFLLGVAAPTAASAQQISYGPILGRGVTGDQMIVKWGTGSAGDATSVSYRTKGSAAAFTTVTGAASKDHEIVLTGLAVDTQFEYYVQSGSTMSSTNTFTTCPAPGMPMDVVFYGDSRSGASEHQVIVNLVLAKAPEIVLESGDIEPYGTYSSYITDFFPVTKTLVASTPFMAVPGNHDASSTLSTNYGLIFPAPRPSGTAWRAYYAFTCGNAMFIGLDANNPSDPTQNSFLQTQLTAAHNDNNVDHVFLWWHQSAFSSGVNHGDDATVQQNWVGPIEAEPKVTAVFSGHDHCYSRLKDGSSKIAWVVSGGAGAGLYNVGATSAAATQYEKMTYNFTQVHIAGGVATGTAYDDTGTQIDTFTVMQATSGGGGGTDGGGGGGTDGGTGGGGGGTDGGTGGGGSGGGGNGGTGGGPGAMNGSSSSGCGFSGAGASSAGALFLVIFFGALVLRRRSA